jgi:hypothetical protein
MTRLLIVVLVLIQLTGCAAITLISNQPQRVADSYSVLPQRTWSSLRDSSSTIWTVDGFALQSLRFFDPIEDGGTLFQRRDDDTRMPRFRADMLASEVEEFVVDSLDAAGAQQVAGHGLAPVNVGATEGFRFELDMLNADGLEMSGLATGAIRDGRLYLVLYTGARAHYFPRYRSQVERLLQTLQITG